MGCDILIGCTGRIWQFITQKSVSLRDIKYVILDEADKLLENPDDIDKILNHNLMLSNSTRNVIMFTATLPVKRIAEQYLHDYIFLSEEDNIG